MPYQGPSPILVFAAAIPISLWRSPHRAGHHAPGDVRGRSGSSSRCSSSLVYIGLIRLLVVDAGALWAEMGRRLDDRAFLQMGGALWALP
jgi:hypothetical protein